VSRSADSTHDVTFVGFLTGHGGDAVQMLHLARGVHQRGARVRIIVPAVETSVAFAERCAQLGIDCERTQLIHADLSGPKQDLRSMFALAREIESPVVHFHTGNSCLPRSLMLALMATRARRGFATLQSPYETIRPQSARARFWAATASRRFHAVVSPSDHGSAFQRACGLPNARIATVRNAIDVRAIASGDGSGPRAELGLAPGDPLIVFTSRLDGQKRPVDAVRIFAGVADEFPRAALVFVGTGVESAAVHTAAAEHGLAARVHLVGHRHDVADWLAAATVWILPTERENFSVAVLEALAAGCPVLSTTCPGNTEVLVDDENSLTFGVGDVAGGTLALSRLLADPELRGRLSHRGVECARLYDVDRMVDEYWALYDRFGTMPAPLGSARLPANHDAATAE
jgi:glycosyltransferase involved in cell wall biosynthesis